MQPNGLYCVLVGEANWGLNINEILYKMKELYNITAEQASHLCKLVNEPYINMMTNNDGKWDSLGLEVQIHTTSTINGDRDDSCIWIYKDGKVRLHRNNGDWGGSRDEPINALLVTDYLREQGYVFKTCN